MVETRDNNAEKRVMCCLKWNLPSQRIVEKLREILRKTKERKMTDVGKTWKELRWLAQDIYQ